MQKILLSINPEHVKNIVDGKKKVEYRRVRCKRNIDSIVIYSTSPEKKIIGEVEVKGIIEGTLEEVWNLTKDIGCISYDFFKKYYFGKNEAVAYELGALKLYPKPKELSEYGIKKAPQSYIYI